jgi:DNA (cytosine-5)-methyltransferase 1
MDLGLTRAGFQTAWQVEIDPFANKILEKHWPSVQRFLNVKSVGKHNLTPVNIISGGSPCQDISIAGKKAGLSGERSGLWFEYARVVRELRPDWVLIENVDRLLRTDGDQVIGQMEEEGYTCRSLVLGAWSVGAAHRRNRTWILCHANGGDAIGEGVGERWSLLQAQVGALAKTHESGEHRFDELVSRNGVSQPESYAGIVRSTHGIPNRMDRLRVLGNAVVPQIPMLIGQFVRAYEEAKEKSGMGQIPLSKGEINSVAPPRARTSDYLLNG